MDLVTTCRGCPNQIEGTLDDGREFYFRGRWGYWYLTVAEPGQPIDYLDDSFGGDHPDAGWWTVDEAEAFCRQQIAALAVSPTAREQAAPRSDHPIRPSDRGADTP